MWTILINQLRCQLLHILFLIHQWNSYLQKLSLNNLLEIA